MTEIPNDPDAARADQTEPAPSARRRWAFRLLALALPLALFMLVEGGLRVAGYGGYPPILDEIGEYQGQRYITTISEGIKPFFVANPDQRGSMDRQFFTMPKPADTVRIVIVGGSAAQGYPQPRSLKLSAFLQAMLTDACPDRKIEVINLGTTAVASFPVSRIARAALPYDPDWMIVYTGNNEFYGAGGVASTHRLGRTARAMRWLHRLRQSAIVQAVSASDDPAPAQPKGGLMDAVLADACIPANDPRRQTAAENLAGNIRDIITACAARGIGVIVCTCPGAEANLAPIGENPKLANPVERRRLDTLLAEAESLRVAQPDEALDRIDQAIELHPTHATAHFVRAQLLAARGDLAGSQQSLWHARDLDTMPWRTPSSSNAAIRQVASEAILCDLEEAFHQASPQGVIGWTLMDDHVHPSLRGQVLIAEQLLETLLLHDRTLATGRGLDAKPVVLQPSNWTTLAERMGQNPLDAYRVVYRVIDLFERPFFQRSNPQALRRFQALQQRLEQSMDPVTRDAIGRLQQVGINVPITGWVAEARMRAGQFASAAEAYRIAERMVPQYGPLHIYYGCMRNVAWRQSRDQERVEANTALADRLVFDCQVIDQFHERPSAMLDAFCGVALAQAGRHPEAIARLERSTRQTAGRYQPVLTAAWIESLVATGQMESARTVMREFNRGLHLADLPLPPEVAHALAGSDGEDPNP
jgi:tetratricopeptide (TPR) repeat protein